MRCEIFNVTDIFRNCSFKIFTTEIAKGAIIEAWRISGIPNVYIDNMVTYLKPIICHKDGIGMFGMTFFVWQNNKPDGSFPIGKFLINNEINNLANYMRLQQNDIVIIFGCDHKYGEIDYGS